jgi:hypothetical protein
MKMDWLELHTPALRIRGRHFYFYDSPCSEEGFGLPLTVTGLSPVGQFLSVGFHLLSAAGIISFLFHGSKLVN